MTRIYCILYLFIASLIVGCASPIPNLDGFVNADALTLEVDDDPSAWYARTEIARFEDAERQRQIVAILKKYDSQWRTIWDTPPWPPARLAAIRDDEVVDGLSISWPLRDGASKVYFQKGIDGNACYVYMDISDARELLRLMNVTESELTTALAAGLEE